MPRALIEPHRGDKRYVRRKGGKFTKSQDDVGRSLSVDRRKQARTKVKSGEGDRGDRNRMPNRETMPHVENVGLVPESHSHAGGPGFNAHCW
jgi:hypothetical protein